MAARHLSPGDREHGQREPGDPEPADRRSDDRRSRDGESGRESGRGRGTRHASEPDADRSVTVWWILAVLVVIVAVLIVVGLRSPAVSGSAGPGASGSAEPDTRSLGAGTASATPSTTAAGTPHPTPTSTSSPTPTATPSPTEDATALQRAQTLIGASERRLGTTPWKLTSVLRGRSCPLSGGRQGLQSEFTDEGPASDAPSADLATLDAYWRGLGLSTRRTTVTDPTGSFAAVQGGGGPVASIQYSVTGAITAVSTCRAPMAPR